MKTLSKLGALTVFIKLNKTNKKHFRKILGRPLLKLDNNYKLSHTQFTFYCREQKTKRLH
jgi:hypothetical protein